jgi:hypothetical protein
VAELTRIEKKELLGSARKIWTYKLMQASGDKKLVKKARDERTRQLPAEIGANELNEAGFWLQKVERLADGAGPQPLQPGEGPQMVFFSSIPSLLSLLVVILASASLKNYRYFR